MMQFLLTRTILSNYVDPAKTKYANLKISANVKFKFTIYKHLRDDVNLKIARYEISYFCTDSICLITSVVWEIEKLHSRVWAAFSTREKRYAKPNRSVLERNVFEGQPWGRSCRYASYRVLLFRTKTIFDDVKDTLLCKATDIEMHNQTIVL